MIISLDLESCFTRGILFNITLSYYFVSLSFDCDAVRSGFPLTIGFPTPHEAIMTVSRPLNDFDVVPIPLTHTFRRAGIYTLQT